MFKRFLIDLPYFKNPTESKLHPVLQGDGRFPLSVCLRRAASFRTCSILFSSMCLRYTAFNIGGLRLLCERCTNLRLIKPRFFSCVLLVTACEI